MKRAPESFGAAKLLAAFAAAVLCAAPSVLAAGPEDWVEFRRVTATPGEIAEFALDDTALLVAGDTSIIRGWDGRRLRIVLPDTSGRILSFQRERLGPLELTVEAVEKGKTPPTAYPAPDPGAPAFGAVSSSEGLTIANVVSIPAASAQAVLAAPRMVESGGEESRVASGRVGSFSPGATNTADARRVASPPPISPPPPPLVLATPPASRTPGMSATPATGNSYDRQVPSPREAAASPSSGATGSNAPVTAVIPSSAPYARSQPVPTGSRVAAESPSARSMSDAAGPIPSSVIERAAPRGSMMRVDTSPLATALAKPGELALFELATDLMARGLFGDAVVQYRRFLNDFPKSGLKEIVLINVGEAYRHRAEMSEKEALRQRDLRRSGAATEAIDAAIADFAEAVTAYRDFQRLFPKSPNVSAVQLAVAQSVHGQVRAFFQKGGQPQDSPAVIVEYLRAYVGLRDTAASPGARLGIAQYYRDLGDARLAAQSERPAIHEAYNRAVEEYNALAAADPGHSAAPEALIDVARLFDRNLEMRRFSEAVRYYEMILQKYPASPFADEARARARWIRENYL
jgi:TolA-binding protein